MQSAKSETLLKKNINQFELTTILVSYFSLQAVYEADAYAVRAAQVFQTLYNRHNAENIEIIMKISQN